MLRRLTCLVASALAVGACGSEDSPTTERDAEVYAAVIRTLAPEDPGVLGTEVDELDTTVYVGPLDDDVEISLEEQIQVVDDLEDFATVTFVDNHDEAIDDAEEGDPVLEDGVLLLLGAVPTDRAPTVDAERYVDVDDSARFRVTLQQSGDEWTVRNVAEEGDGSSAG
jgi:hypothetical protein